MSGMFLHRCPLGGSYVVLGRFWEIILLSPSSLSAAGPLSGPCYTPSDPCFWCSVPLLVICTLLDYALGKPPFKAAICQLSLWGLVGSWELRTCAVIW